MSLHADIRAPPAHREGGYRDTLPALTPHHHNHGPLRHPPGRGFFYAHVTEGPALNTTDYVAQILTTAPVLTDEQKAHLAGLFTITERR